MSAIAANCEVYGKYARLSALADYLEVRALMSRELRREALADLISDNGWQLPDLISPPEHYEPTNLSSVQDQSRDAADRILGLIRERSDILREKYPFDLQEDLLTIKPGLTPQDDPYIALLSITVGHAFELSTLPSPHDVFEDVIEAVLRGRLEYAINFGRIGRGLSSFEAAVEDACPRVLLRGQPRSAWRSARAQDEKVDTIANLSWADYRPGHWTFVGQATCGKSESWEKKINEPAPAAWAMFLGVTPWPHVFLAVPHHVETHEMHRLVQNSQRIVLDRLRLVAFKGSNTADERTLTDVMLQAELDDA